MKILNYIALLGLTVGSANAATISQSIGAGQTVGWAGQTSVSAGNVAFYENIAGSVIEGGETINFTYDLTVTMTSADGGWAVGTPGTIFTLGAGVLSDTSVFVGGGGSRMDNGDTLTFSISGIEETSVAYDIEFDGFTGLLASNWETGEGWSVNGATANTATIGTTFGSLVGNGMVLTGVEPSNGITLGTVSHQFSTTPVTPAPEPSSTALLGLGGLALILRRRK